MLQLPLLLLTVLVTASAKCPLTCTCRNVPLEMVPTSYLHSTTIKCVGFPTSNSTQLSNLTRILEVSRLDDESFANLVQTLAGSDLPELNALSVMNSFIGNISNVLDVIGDKIKSVSFQRLALSEVPDLSECSSLVSLDLSSNGIAQLSNLRTLASRTLLQSLNLSANYIYEIGSQSFQNLTSLKILDLSSNNLSALCSNILGPLTGLNYLNLSHNRIQILSDDSFSSLAHLQQLDLSWNNLARMAPGSLQLPNLTRLLLAGNFQLGNTSAIIAEVGRKLHTVDASRIGLKRVPGTLTHSIRTLRLAGNSIKELTCGELDTYPLLQVLDFTSNGINSIEDDALGRQESLAVLYLSDNKLPTIPKSLPEQLTELHLEWNAIQKVLKGDLQGLPNLEVLLLNDNKITSIEGGAFAYLRSLVTLDLSRNSIKALYPGSLTGPSALQILRLSGIDTVAPAEDVSFPLSAPDHLVSLDLSGSAGLARQLLADRAALAASKELQELDISGADLEFIRSDLLHFLPELRVIRLRDNRLNCSNLQWLAAWMRRQDRNDQVTCASPPELWGTPLLDLQYADSYSIEQINHDDFEGAINLVNAIGKNSPRGKYFSGGITTITTNKSIQVKEDDDNDPKLRSLDNKAREVSDNEIVGIGDFTSGRVAKKDMETIKVVNKILVPSADLRLSSLIPVTNERKKYFETRSTSTKGQDETDSNRASTASTDSSQHFRGRNNGPTAALNKTQTPHNLASNERNFSDTSGLVGANKSDTPTLQVNMTEDVSQWNASTIRTSMFRNDENQGKFLHPGMLILAMGILCAGATLATLAVRFNSRKRWMERRESADSIPVASISSITELW
ncbi:transforming growth factor beta activator LRRC33-like [Euwallacea similis]|uniref:transforming growth factor beta activator LRRC33-like n=1 Tax=Euwallacea similis TaxID=1736056 RepID=UPI00344E7CC5